MAQPLQTVSVVDAVAAQLRKSLLSGAFQAGEEIKDTRVAQSYGVARPTARIAVQQLVTEGVLVRPAGQSARVRTFNAEQVRDLYRVRTMLELNAIRGIRAEGAALDRIEKALEGFAGLREGDDWAKLADADVTFHSAVVDAADSPRLSSYFAGISGETRLLIALLRTNYQRGSDLYDEHENLLSLLSGSGTQERLEQQWFEHLDNARVFLESYLSHD